MVYIKHRLGIKAPIEKVYNALGTTKGVAGWWTNDATGTSEINGLMLLKFRSPDGKELGLMNIQILALESNKKVHWRFLDGPKEWIGTEVIFDLKQEDDYTILLFSHINWVEEVEFKAHCSMKWAVFLMSLKEFVETGKGKPAPHDIKIDNWN